MSTEPMRFAALLHGGCIEHVELQALGDAGLLQPFHPRFVDVRRDHARALRAKAIADARPMPAPEAVQRPSCLPVALP